MLEGMAQPLPQLFARLTEDDWNRLRAHVAGLGKGEEEAAATSVGYVDVGRTDGGAVYVAGNSFGPGGAGAPEYRKLYQMQWPTARARGLASGDAYYYAPAGPAGRRVGFAHYDGAGNYAALTTREKPAGLEPHTRAAEHIRRRIVEDAPKRRP